jgi:hypothetical protein
MDAETRRRRWYDGSARRSMAEISVRRTNWSPRATSRVNCLCRRELAVIITCTNDPRITEDQVTDPRTRALGRWLCSVEKGFVSTTPPGVGSELGEHSGLRRSRGAGCDAARGVWLGFRSAPNRAH